VLRCLPGGVRWLRLRGADVALADKSAITKARARLGAEPLKALFARLAGPLAAADTPGAWYRGRRLASLDGTTTDLPYHEASPRCREGLRWSSTAHPWTAPRSSTTAASRPRSRGADRACPSGQAPDGATPSWADRATVIPCSS